MWKSSAPIKVMIQTLGIMREDVPFYGAMITAGLVLLILVSTLIIICIAHIKRR